VPAQSHALKESRRRIDSRLCSWFGAERLIGHIIGFLGFWIVFDRLAFTPVLTNMTCFIPGDIGGGEGWESRISLCRFFPTSRFFALGFSDACLCLKTPRSGVGLEGRWPFF